MTERTWGPTDEESDEFLEGYSARKLGFQRSDNPYVPGEHHEAWDDGWQTADEDLEQFE